MSAKLEISELMNKSGEMYEWSERVVGGCNLSAEDKEIAEVVDAWAKEIGKTGNDKDHMISEYILKTVTDPIYDKPDELLDRMFDRDGIGEFDDYEINKTPKNTLIAHEAAKGGNVDKSYIDGSVLTPTWHHAQVETELSFAQLRRGGFKSIAQLSVFAREALLNKKIKDVFTTLDTAITGGEAAITVSGTTVDKTSLDKLCLYVLDRIDTGDDAFLFGLNKYAQQIANIAGYTSFMSDTMKDNYNRYGLIHEYGGLTIAGFSGAKKASDGELLVPDGKIFGVAGKVGTLTDRGELRIYEDMDNNKEKVSLKFTGYEYGIAIVKPDKVGKITING